MIEKKLHNEEIEAKAISGMLMLILNILLMLASIGGFIYGLNMTRYQSSFSAGISLIAAVSLYLFIIGPILFAGLKVLKPNEAFVLTLFGKYYGTLKGEGFFFVNPFVVAFNPTTATAPSTSQIIEQAATTGKPASSASLKKPSKIISLKTMTLNNDKQKINDELGNPIIIGIVVIWKVVNTAKAVFNVDNYTEFLSIQCDSSLRNIVRL